MISNSRPAEPQLGHSPRSQKQPDWPPNQSTNYSLQTVKRAEWDGADIELIVAALIHDVGNAMASENYSQVSATIIRPFSPDEVILILQMHGLFKMHYFEYNLDLEKMLEISIASINYSMRLWNSVKNETRYLLFLNIKNELSYFEPTTIQQSR